MQRLGEISKAVALSICISAGTSGAASLYNVVNTAKNNEELLKANIQATNELAKSLNELRYQFVNIPNQYVSRAEMKELMQEIKEQRTIRRSNDGP